MASIEKREKRRLNRTRRNRKDELEVEDLSKESVEPIEEPGTEEAEPLEKGYYSDPHEVVSINPAIYPTSYDELDAAREAMEKADKLRRETYTVQDLVSNIAYSAMSPEDKSKAIVSVGKGFGSRLKTIANEKVEKEYDLDLLQLQAIVAIDSRHTSVIEKAADFIANAFTTPVTHTKTSIRKELKNMISILEKGLDMDDALLQEWRTATILALLKSAKDVGIGVSNTVLIEKDASGSWRAVLFPTNNFKDRDEEIITKDAHEEYVEWVNKNMDCAPVFATWHKPGTARANQMDFIGYESGIMITSLPLTESEAGRLLKMQTQVDIGLSIGGIALERDGNTITKYRIFEVSDLPLERAANPFTEIELISKEAQMDMQKYLTDMLGDEERAKSILGKMALTQKQLRDSGVEEKEVKATEPVPAVVVNNAPPVDMKELAEKLSKELGMEQLSETITGLMESAEKVAVLEALVKELAASKDEELAQMISPKMEKAFSWQSARASQSKTTILDEKNEEDKKLSKSVPTGGWLSEVTGVAPVKQ